MWTRGERVIKFCGRHLIMVPCWLDDACGGCDGVDFLKMTFGGLCCFLASTSLQRLGASGTVWKKELFMRQLLTQSRHPFSPDLKYG